MINVNIRFFYFWYMRSDTLKLWSLDMDRVRVVFEFGDVFFGFFLRIIGSYEIVGNVWVR